MFIDEKTTTTSDGYKNETIMIEISLTEYRFLVAENSRMMCELDTLRKENDVLRNMR